MTGLRRPVLSLLALSLFSLASTAQSTFEQGVEALMRGNIEEALKLFQQVLAEDASNADAYELWQSVAMGMAQPGGSLRDSGHGPNSG